MLPEASGRELPVDELAALAGRTEALDFFARQDPGNAEDQGERG